MQYLAKDETVTATYTITLADDSGDSATDTTTQTVTVTITGTNDRPAISVVDAVGRGDGGRGTVADNPNTRRRDDRQLPRPTAAQ